MSSPTSRSHVRELFAALERGARQAVALGEAARLDVGENRFSSYLQFRRQFEEAWALAALTEKKLATSDDPRLPELRSELDRLDMVLSVEMVRVTHDYFLRIGSLEALPLGAHDLFEPELRVMEELRARLTASGRGVPAELLGELEAALGLIRSLLDRTPALADFTDSPSLPRPLRPLRILGVTHRS